MNSSIRFLCCIILFVFFIAPFSGTSRSMKKTTLSIKAEKRIHKRSNLMPEWRHVGHIVLDSLNIINNQDLIQLYFSTPLSYIPVRESEVTSFEHSIRKALGRRFHNYSILIYTDHHLLKELVPNAMRISFALDQNRMSTPVRERIPVVMQIGKDKPGSGLFNNNIALWDSHGWYFDSKSDRWKWQRARLFGTVEDMSPMSYVLPYLIPMLENSGAAVFIPRERDWQSEAVYVDNDSSSKGSRLIIPSGLVSDRKEVGFILKDSLKSGDNPFSLGSSLRFINPIKDQQVQFVPDFDIKGRYSVSVTYQHDSTALSDVIYTVYHAGGETKFSVNQKIGGGTWIYLGTFDFFAGINPENGKVTVSAGINHLGSFSVDAVKFGGGMGNVARRPTELTSSGTKFSYKLSGKPKYLEGARYYLQSSGFPDTLTYSLNKDKNDYNDDYQSRGEWINYLMGSPNGPDKNRNVTGVKIPIDLGLAFHTDAGITPNDSIIGTLGIYSTKGDMGLFPNGKSRLASRDLTDIIQTQLVVDIRTLFNPNWTRRGLWDKPYSEAWRPNVPVMLLELLSHQNIADMRLGLDPRFRFSVSRAIYKGMLKFQAFQENRPFVVHPLPIDHFVITLLDSDSVRLCWSGVSDPLEPTAKPDKFRIYRRINDGGFDNGFVTKDTTVVLKLDRHDTIYSFKVAASNEGGESFAGEILSVGIKSQSKGEILVVNGFDRICGPAIFDNCNMSGLARWKDQGVADHQDISFVGDQYDFDRKSKWLDDDSPGWGASYGNMEGKAISGNSFDYPIIHGKAILAAGYSFVSSSDEVFSRDGFDISPYFATDIIMGEERSTPDLKQSGFNEFKIYTPGLMAKISQICKNNGNIILSGAYIGSEFGESKDSVAGNFVKNILHFTWRTGHASKRGAFYATDYVSNWFHGKWNWNTDLNDKIYASEAPDGIEPSGSNAYTAFRYGENNISAGIVYKGKYRIVAMGIPFETICDQVDSRILMEQITRFFELK